MLQRMLANTYIHHTSTAVRRLRCALMNPTHRA